jgi:hypothetical protein
MAKSETPFGKSGEIDRTDPNYKNPAYGYGTTHQDPRGQFGDALPGYDRYSKKVDEKPGAERIREDNADAVQMTNVGNSDGDGSELSTDMSKPKFTASARFTGRLVI